MQDAGSGCPTPALGLVSRGAVSGPGEVHGLRHVPYGLDRQRGAVTATCVSPTGSPPLNADPDEAARGEIEPIELNEHNVRTTAGCWQQASGPSWVNQDQGRRRRSESGRDPTPAEAKVGIATPSAPNPPEPGKCAMHGPAAGVAPGPPTRHAGAGAHVRHGRVLGSLGAVTGRGGGHHG